MKRNLLFIVVLFVALSSRADIVYTDYAEGWRIDLNENVAMDINDDGIVDFYINGYLDEIGFVPVFGQGCFTSPDEYVYNSIGSRKLDIHQAGDLLQLNSTNLYDYIDDDRGSMYSVDNGFAEDWNDLQYQYIGFVVILPDAKTWDGWMQVAVDQEANQMIIKDMAYETEGDFTGGGPGIEAGETGITSVANLDNQVRELNISPNPTSSQLNLQFDYQGKADLSIAVLNAIGQVVYTHQTAALANRNTIVISTSTWAEGTYVVQLSSEEGVSAQRVVVAR